ncbi:MAG: ATPase, type, partial [Firmicutes bacterium]|nr:ATPase, type [Bacillota bacterium]
AEVYPEDKFLIVKALQDAGHVVGMTGDGVNDAPALKQAEVGIAVSNASDVAKEAASVVLTTEGLAGIISLIKIGRTVHRRIQIWVLNKISRTILKATFVVGSFLLTGSFLVSALAMLLLIFMTDFAKIALATDRVHWSPKPTTLNIAPMTRMGIILGVAMVLEIALLMYIGIHYFGLMPGEGRLNTYSFLSLFFFAIFSLFVVRQDGHFWQSKPSVMLGGVILADIIIASMIGVYGVSDLPGIDGAILLFIIAYSLLFSIGVNDLLKVHFQNEEV